MQVGPDSGHTLVQYMHADGLPGKVDDLHSVICDFYMGKALQRRTRKAQSQVLSEAVKRHEAEFFDKYAAVTGGRHAGQAGEVSQEGEAPGRR